MDTGFILFLMWCACSQKQLSNALLSSVLLYEGQMATDTEGSSIAGKKHENRDSNKVISMAEPDAKAVMKTLSSFEVALDVDKDTRRGIRSNLKGGAADVKDDDHSLPGSLYTDYPMEDVPLVSLDEVNDEMLNDSPMTKYGNSYPYQALPRRQLPEKLMYTKEVVLKQGRVKGIVRSMHPQTGLRDVDQYLGLPYAEAPVGSRRFMPPGTPLPWQGLKIARHLPPVCPQKIPDITSSSTKMSKGRYEQLIRLLPYLKTENEDCLYLNVYVPRGDRIDQSTKYPVIAYLHGESFEWNSGNPYDGSVLASYGQVVVVTVNYRLGVLGFLRPGIGDDTVSNFGLLDQIAALNWIKENIEELGGDKNSVTLMGHSTGAACVNYLMVSPVASGLFHRAILMSGSAMADWASSNNSLQLTMQMAHSLNCPLNDASEEMLSCLRTKRYEEIRKIPTKLPRFTTSLGPIVDGLVIPNQPYKVMSQYTELFSRYDLLFGVTEVESYHTLNAQQLEDGMDEQERDSLLRFYMQSRFDIRPDLALAATLKKYTDMYNNPVKASSLEHRDVVLDILSDARVVGPIIQTGLFHADVNPRNYMYVFGHNSAAGPHASLPHSITGEELAFVFGAPLAPAGPFHNKYNAQEKLLSEAVMSYWTNFAKTGNPKAPWRGTFINLHALEWDRYDLDWPEFSKRNQCYINIGIPPSIGYKYRQVYMNFWNKELPDELNQIGTIQQQPYIHTFPHGPTQLPRGGTSLYSTELITGQLNKFPPAYKEHNFDDPQRTLRILLQKSNPSTTAKETAESMYNAPPTFGIIHRTKSDEELPATTPISSETSTSSEQEVAKSESTMQLLIGLIAIFIVLNIIIYSTFLMQKKKKSSIMGRKLKVLSYDGTTDDDFKRSKNNDGDDSYILDMVRKSNTYEAVKTSQSPINGFKITRQLSSSTVDAHTKVCDWMAQETTDKGNAKSSKRSSSPTFSLRGKSFLKMPQKVSVAIDATPQARSNSVLRQEPIEVTKLKADGPRNLIICQEVDVDTDLFTEDSINSSCFRDSICSNTSSTPPQQTITEDLSATQSHGLCIDHKHSHSDPLEMYYTVHSNDEEVTSFINEDISVTCREPSVEKNPLTLEQQIHAIKRRNFPKVLPSYPRELFGNQTTSSTHTSNLSTNSDRLSNSIKRTSLPPNSFSPNQIAKLRPMPPPRTISTLGRKPPSLRRQSHSITTSPVMLARDCPEEEEPKITQNTLIVGPIIPKMPEGNYSTINKKRPPNLGLNSNTTLAEAYTSISAPVTPSTFEHFDPLLTANQNVVYPTGASQTKELTSITSSTSLCSTFQPTPVAHHTEAKYTIPPRVTDLTPLVIKQSLQGKLTEGRSNIPRKHMTDTDLSVHHSTPTGAVFEGSLGQSASRIPQLKTRPVSPPKIPLSPSKASLQNITGISKSSPGATNSMEAVNNFKTESSTSSIVSSSSSSSMMSTTSSSGDTTSSSTGTVKRGLKQK